MRYNQHLHALSLNFHHPPTHIYESCDESILPFLSSSFSQKQHQIILGLLNSSRQNVISPSVQPHKNILADDCMTTMNGSNNPLHSSLNKSRKFKVSAREMRQVNSESLIGFFTITDMDSDQDNGGQ